MLSVALTIAGSDPSGGAGLQADLKTFHQFGVYGMAVVTLVTVQNTRLVSRVEMLSAELVGEQIEAVTSDIHPTCAKTGALGNVEIIERVAEHARFFRFPLVVDPVMISKHGARLLSEDAEQSLKTLLFPHALLVTPNIPEAEILTGMKISGEEDMAAAADKLLEWGSKAVLVKGGHTTGEPVDVLSIGGQHHLYRGKRVTTRHTHGTGCTYSAAITAGLARGRELEEAVSEAKAFVQAAIETAPGLGGGYGPVNHFAPGVPRWTDK